MRRTTHRQVGQSARSGADLQNHVGGSQLRCVNESAHEVAVDQEMPAKPFSRTQPGLREQSFGLPLGLDMFLKVLAVVAPHPRHLIDCADCP